MRAGVARLLGGRVDEESPERALLDEIFRSFPGLLAFKDAGGVYVRVNQAMARHLGAGDPALVVGRTDAGLPAPAAGGGSPPPAKPEPSFVLSTASVRDRSGRVVGTLTFGLDVGEAEAARRHAERLEEERSLLRDVLDRIPDQIYAKNDRHQFVFANAAVAWKIVGAPEPDRVLGRTDHDFFPDQDADQYRADEAQLMTSGRDLLDLEERAVYQGKPRWNLSTKRVFRNRQGKVVGLIGINRDITAQKEAQAALAMERHLLHSLMDNIPDCIYFKDAQGRFIRANRAQAELVGASSAERLVGRRLSEVLPSASSRESEADEQKVVATGVPLVGKVEQLRGGDGASRWMLSTKVPLRDGEGAVTGLVGISRDVTERKAAEEALERGLASFLAFVSRVAEGDLTLRAPEGTDILGRIGSAVNRMLDGLDVILGDVKRTVMHLASAAGEILSASRNIADGAERQSHEVRATSSSVEEMAASMQTVSRSAGTSAEASRAALAHVELGDGSVRDTSAAMVRIQTAVQQTADRMHLLARRVEEISSIIELIDEVASQSTLLSLNAAIQAAHAGEAGRGFGVVADEIRKLADRSMQATREVGRIIEAIQAETAEAVDAMKKGTREVQGGCVLSDRARQALAEISGAVGETVRLSASISQASTEQAQVTQQLALTMETIAAISQDSSAGAHQTAQTVQVLFGLSRDLEAAISRFSVREVATPAPRSGG